MKILAIVIIISWLASHSFVSSSSPETFANSKWRIETFELESKILSENKVDLKANRKVMVWLPPSYSNSGKRFPVIHYLHNANWSNRQMADEERIHETFDRALNRGLVGEFIFVAGDFTTTLGSGTFFGNNTVAGRWQDHIVEELVPEVDKRYRTLANKKSRAVSGDFLGGYGALRVAMHHPDVFSSVYALHPVGTGVGARLLSPFPDWNLLNTAKSYDDLADASGYTHAFLMMAQSFVPNVNKPPFYVDWIVELKGDELVPNPKTISRLRQNFSFNRHMMNYVDNLKQLTAIGFDWGRRDPTKAHIEGNRALADALSDLGIDHIAEEYNGDQWSEKWVPFGRVENDMLPFMQRYLAFE